MNQIVAIMRVHDFKNVFLNFRFQFEKAAFVFPKQVKFRANKAFNYTERVLVMAVFHEIFIDEFE